MPLPFSKNQVRKLGQRLRAEEIPGDDDLIMLEVLLAAYDEALNTAVTAISDTLGVSPSQRLKNTGTIVEKLRRSSATHLANIQDLAGARVVLDGGNPIEQDQFVAQLSALLQERGWEYHVVDRRLAPMQGYRAVHIVVQVDLLPVEVQVRTAWQHQWAESFEKIADLLGRSIRYSSEIDIDDVLTSLRLFGAVPDEIRVALMDLASGAVQTALAYSSAIAEAEAALTAGVAAAEVEAIVAGCNALMQRANVLLVDLVTGPRIDAIRYGRGL